MHPTRREFLWGTSALFLMPLERWEPEIILHNGNVITMESGLPRAEAVAISQGRFLAVGSDNEILRLAAGGARKINLGGGTVVPGFIDAHSHPAEAGLLHLRAVDCDLRSIGAIQDALHRRAAATKPGDWVTGFKYDDTKTLERRFLTLADLDVASVEHPIYVQHRGGHTVYVNSHALKKAGIKEDTPDPPGGHLHRDYSGKLSGRLEERAAELVEKLIPNEENSDERRKGVALISRMMIKAGLTSVHDAYGSPERLRAYREAYEAGESNLRIYCLIGFTHIDKMLEAGVKTGFGDEWVRVGAMKQTCDGSISERTARLSLPYADRPGYYGLLVSDEDELYERARKAHAVGWQNGVHANGDVAIDKVLRVYERLQKEMPRVDARYRIEHCTVINPQLVQRMRGLGAIPNPFSTYVYYHGEKMQAYGAERLQSMFAVRSFLDAGLFVTMTSDYPPGPFEPMMALQSMVTRTDSNGNQWGPKQRITVQEALKIGTVHGAHASFEENLKGTIRPGKLADLVVLEKDPTKTTPMDLINIKIQRTMVGGTWAYES